MTATGRSSRSTSHALRQFMRNSPDMTCDNVKFSCTTYGLSTLMRKPNIYAKTGFPSNPIELCVRPRNI
ncbi:hypothetical protein J3F82_005097, partial [Coemansia sp. RSA 637]